MDYIGPPILKITVIGLNFTILQKSGSNTEKWYEKEIVNLKTTPFKTTPFQNTLIYEKENSQFKISK